MCVCWKRLADVSHVRGLWFRCDNGNDNMVGEHTRGISYGSESERKDRNYIEHICEVGAKILVFSLVLFAFLCIKNIKFYVFLRQKFSVAFFELTLGVCVWDSVAEEGRSSWDKGPFLNGEWEGMTMRCRSSNCCCCFLGGKRRRGFYGCENPRKYQLHHISSSSH